jgi:hypothetical protein
LYSPLWLGPWKAAASDRTVHIMMEKALALGATAATRDPTKA